MNEIQNEIKQAFDTANQIMVCGDNVDLLALVKIHLRKAYELAGKEDANGGQTDKRTDSSDTNIKR